MLGELRERVEGRGGREGRGEGLPLTQGVGHLSQSGLASQGHRHDVAVIGREPRQPKAERRQPNSSVNRRKPTFPPPGDEPQDESE